MGMRPLLWAVMRDALGNPDLLRNIAAGMTREQLILLNRRFGTAAGELAAEPQLQQRTGPEHAWRVACWVVGQGKKPWLQARANPETLPHTPPAEAADLPAILDAVYSDRFGEPIPEQEPEPTDVSELRLTPEWEEEAWALIDLLNAGVPPEEALGQYTRSELILLYGTLERIADDVRGEFVAELGDDPMGMDWVRWADCAVSQGRCALDAYRSRPEELPRSFPDSPPPALDRVHDEYEARYQAPIPPEQPEV